jgi:pSer/pThr/pTyr-binding forkhead associated (FHA) protein
MKITCPKCGALLHSNKKLPIDDPAYQVKCWMCTFAWTPEIDSSLGKQGPPTISATPTRNRSKDVRLGRGTTDPPTASLALPADKTIRISVIGGTSQGMEYDMSRPLVTVGRLKGGADLEIDDPEVSAVHCAVEARRDTILLHDLRSTNGTFIGNTRVSAARLEPSSEFRIGSSLLTVSILPRA